MIDSHTMPVAGTQGVGDCVGLALSSNASLMRSMANPRGKTECDIEVASSRTYPLHENVVTIESDL